MRFNLILNSSEVYCTSAGAAHTGLDTFWCTIHFDCVFQSRKMYNERPQRGRIVQRRTTVNYILLNFIVVSCQFHVIDLNFTCRSLLNNGTEEDCNIRYWPLKIIRSCNFEIPSSSLTVELRRIDSGTSCSYSTVASTYFKLVFYKKERFTTDFVDLAY